MYSKLFVSKNNSTKKYVETQMHNENNKIYIFLSTIISVMDFQI